MDPMTPVSYGPGMRWSWILLLAVGCAGPKYAERDEYVPFEIGRSWVYSIQEQGAEPFQLATRVLGSDVRPLAGERRVEFMQAYGRISGMDQDVTKSIVAMASDGPHEMVFNAWTWTIEHDPPIALLPATFQPGMTTEWKGVVTYRDERYETTATISADGVQIVETPSGDLSCLLVRTVYDAGGLVVRRWFAPGVGLVEIKVSGKAGGALATLVSHAPPPR